MQAIEKPSVRLYHAAETERMQELEGAELASFQARAAALLLAFIIFVPGAFAAGTVAEKYLGFHDLHIELNFFENWFSIIYLVVFFGLSTYLGNGQTIGKKAFRIRAVSLVHHRMSLWHSVERALGYGASTLEGGFGFLQYFIHPNRRTVHDRMAETIVIRENKAASKV